MRDLVEMGFSRVQVEAALSKTHGNKETALGLLLGSASMAPPDPCSLRAPGTCVALLHISGTAYINSLLQAYFAIPVLCKTILSFSAQPDSEPDLTRDSVNLLFSLQRLFAQLALSERKAVDPSPVLARMRDDAGKAPHRQASLHWRRKLRGRVQHVAGVSARRRFEVGKKFGRGLFLGLRHFASQGVLPLSVGVGNDH